MNYWAGLTDQTKSMNNWSGLTGSKWGQVPKFLQTEIFLKIGLDVLNRHYNDLIFSAETRNNIEWSSRYSLKGRFGAQSGNKSSNLGRPRFSQNSVLCPIRVLMFFAQVQKTYLPKFGRTGFFWRNQGRHFFAFIDPIHIFLINISKFQLRLGDAYFCLENFHPTLNCVPKMLLRINANFFSNLLYTTNIIEVCQKISAKSEPGDAYKVDAYKKRVLHAKDRKKDGRTNGLMD